jgi:uncharacterized protein (DUF2062 family)
VKLKIDYRELFRTLISLDDTPKKLAVSFAVGVFISTSPFFGLHTLLAVFLSFIFRLNKVAAIIGSWVNTPWSAPFVYYAEYKIGDVLLGLNSNFTIKPFTIEHYLQNGYGAFLSIFIGSIIMGIIFSIIFYFLIKYFVEKHRRRIDVSAEG